MKIPKLLYIIFFSFFLTTCQTKESYDPLPFAILGFLGEDSSTYESTDNASASATDSNGSSTSDSGSGQGSLTSGSGNTDNLIIPPPPIAATPIASTSPNIPGVPKMQVEIDTNPGVALTSGTQATFGSKSLISSPPTCNASHANAHQIKLRNLASASGALNVESITLETSSSHFAMSTVSTGDVAVGNENSFYICFQPATTGYKAATIIVRSNDHTAPEFRLLFTGFGIMQVTATVLKPSTGVGRFQNIILEFSHAMDRGTVCKDSSTTNHNEGTNSVGNAPITIYETANPSNKIYGRCFWGIHNGSNFTSYTQLIFDPYKPLAANTSYTLEIPDGKIHPSLGSNTIERVCLTAGSCNVGGIKTSFTTEYNYDATFVLSGFTLGSNGVVLNKASATTVTLASSITNSSQADSITLKKVGSTDTTSWSANMTLSSLSGGLQASDGSNSYLVEIKKGTKTYYRSFSFAWGTVAADPTTYINDAGNLALGTGVYGVERLSMLLQRFIKSDGSNTNDNFRIPGDYGRSTFAQYIEEPRVNFHSTSAPMPGKFPSNGHPGTGRNNKGCISDWGAHPDFGWVANFGPLCGINFTINNVPLFRDGAIPSPLDSLFNIPVPDINGVADVYVRNIKIENVAENGSNNVEATLTPQNGRLDANLNAKRLRGTLRLHLEVPNKCYGLDINVKIGICPVCVKFKGCLGAELNGKGIVYDLDFMGNPSTSMTKYSTSGSYRNDPTFGLATSRNYLTVDSSGNVNLNVISTPSNACNGDVNMNVCDVNSKIIAYNARMVQQGQLNVSVGFISINVNDIIAVIVEYLLDNILNDLVPGLQWEIVQGLLKDVLEVVAPNVLNAVFAQLRFDGGNDGMDVQLPDYLPPPFDQTKLNVGVKLKEQSTNATSSAGLGLGVHAGIKAQIGGSPQTPPTLQSSGAAVNSFVTFDGGKPLPPLDGATGLYTRLSSDSGVLIALRADAVNQAMYQLWKAGGFNLTLNQSFADSIKAFRGDDDRLFQIFQILLKASALKKVLAPGAASVMYAKDQSNGDALIEIRDSDDMEFRVIPLQPPVLKSLPLSESKSLTGSDSDKKYPLVEAEFGSLKIEVVGKRTGLEYKLATLLVNFRSKAALNIHKFSSPINGNNNNYQDVTSIQLNICDDNDYTGNTADAALFDCDAFRSTYTSNDDLSFSVEVLEGTSNNPLSLDPGGIHEVLSPTIQKLIIPVLNYVLNELPLEQKSKDYASDTTYNPSAGNFGYNANSKEDPNMPNNKIAASCGVRLNDMKILPIPEGETNPYFLINAKLSDYTFSGSCSL
ncbi:MAG: hypothetical protein AAF518_09330 [Spirochaetota bacterium]